MALLQHLSTLATYLPHYSLLPWCLYLPGMLLLILIKLQARARRVCRRRRRQAGAYKKEGLPRWGRRLTACSERGVHSFLPKLFKTFPTPLECPTSNLNHPPQCPYLFSNIPLSTSILDPILAISHVIPTLYFYSFS
jgi:hypothetical protein